VINAEWEVTGKRKGEKMYEYVTKAEYQPVRKEIEAIIQKVRNYMWTHYKVKFQDQLIGSGKRHLITRTVKGNGGYDFDYNLIISSSIQGKSNTPKKLKQQFMEAFSVALKGTKYSAPQYSTSAITIKVIDKKHSKVLHSCDFAIIYYKNDLKTNGYYYLKNNKSQKQYIFEYRELSKNIDLKLQKILCVSNGWALIRDEYIKLKNNNKDINKHSFSLYLEAIHNVYNCLPRKGEKTL
jgi:hypothetical protein